MRPTPPEAAHIHNANQSTNAGLNCMTAGCHEPGNAGAGGAFYFAGTVYEAAATTTADQGVTISITNGGVGSAITVQSDTAGNFYYSEAITLTNAAVSVDVCSSTNPNVAANSAMAATISAGACNSSGCHATGAQGPFTGM